MTPATKQNTFTLPLLLVFLYILVEYGRPSFFASLRVALFVYVALLLLFLRHIEEIMAIIRDNYFKLFLLLLVEMTIHVFIAANNRWAYMRWEVMVLVLILNLAICLSIKDAKQLKIFLAIFVFVHVLSASARIMSTPFFGSSGYIGDTNDFALAMNIVIPISYYVGLSYHGKTRIAYWFAATLFVVANVHTFSRGGFIGLAFVAFLCWLKSKVKVRALLALLIAAIAFFIFMPEDYKAELLTIKTEGIEGGTGRDRIEMWKLAGRVFLDHPIIGVGPGNMVWLLGNYQDDEQTDFWGRSATGRQVHSTYFDTLAELGIIGVIIFGAMIYNLAFKYRYVTKECIETKPGTKGTEDQLFLENAMQGLYIGLWAFLVNGALLSAFYYPHFWNMAALMTVVYRLRLELEGESRLMQG